MKPIFRNAMFGFNKEDVFHFVSKQSKQYEQKINDLTAEKERLEKDFDKEREEFSEKLAEMEKDLLAISESKTLIEETKRLLALVVEDAGAVETASVSCGENAEKMKTNILVLKDQVAKSEALREKATRFDQLSSALSGIFGGEKSASDEISALNLENPELAEYTTESFGKLKMDVENLCAHLSQLSALYSSEK